MSNVPQPPPLLAYETFVRVLRVARSDGLSIVVISGSLALFFAYKGEVGGALLGLLVAGAGAMELHGVGLLRHGYTTGVDWLVRGQLFLLAVMSSYCAFRLMHVDLEPIRTLFHEMLRLPGMQAEWRAAQEQSGVTEDEYLRLLYSINYVVIAAASLLYQGGMTLYYTRRRAAVLAALAVD